MVSPAPRRVMSSSLTGGVRRGEMKQKVVFLCGFCVRADAVIKRNL